MTKLFKQQIALNFYFFNYKNSNSLKKFISRDRKILSKFRTTLAPKNQRKLSKSIKTARIIGLLKFLNN
uniref:50S ribosomal protein S18 n=1 Tax=Lotharella vacuolata TaxID=74820 RepID=A0A140JZT2_9EUKA|nr:50S ribosomal protein S18 [Lotharella vacuolata]BAU62609.1 50S ribosomal protein S18 [Lotharella vacuolata]